MAASFGNTINSSLENALRQATGTADAAVGTASSGLNSVLNGQGAVTQAVGGMNANAQKMNQSADNAVAASDEAKSIFPPNADVSIWDVMARCALSQPAEAELKRYTESLGLI